MNSPPYQKLFWGSYHKNTAHLSHAREHGAYLLLIAALWNNEGRLPSDDDTLAGYAKLSVKEWMAIKPKLMPMFRVVRGKLTQPRVSEDLAKYRDTSCKRKQAGKAGGKASSGKLTGKRQANASGLPTQSESEPDREVEDKSSPSPGAGAPQGEWDEVFDRLIAAYPGKRGRGSPVAARSAFDAVPPERRAKLPGCAVAYGLDQGWGSNGPPSLARWISEGFYIGFLSVSVARQAAWQGPALVRDHVVSRLGEGAARSYVDTADWRPESQTILTRTQYAADQLRGLRMQGINVEKQEAAA